MTAAKNLMPSPGNESFKEFIRGNCYYVDKTPYLKTIFNYRGSRLLMLRPRRFGKTLMIFHTRKARFTFEKPVAWTRDGEAGGEYREIELCNYHRPIQLIF